jgi:hypothetical protein
MAETQDAYQITWGSGVTSVGLGASVTCDPFPVHRASAFAVDLNFTTTSTPVGTFDLQVANVPVRNGSKLIADDANNANWVSLGITATAGTTTPPVMMAVTANSFSWARIVYTRSSGGASDTANAWVQVRVV